MSNHHIDLLIPTESHELLDESDIQVLSDIAEAAEFDIVDTPEGPEPRYNLDVIVTSEGMSNIEATADGDTELADLCSALVEVADETKDTAIVGRINPTEDDSRQLQAWKRDFDPMEEIEDGELEDGEIPDGDPLGDLVRDLREA